jgi:error-prone DNA polymerase
MLPRAIVHLDADAFFASVEQAADVRLRGKPVAVGGEKRGIVASASYEARRFGIYTPMPTVRARRLCPNLIVVPGDFEKYEHFSRWMFSYAQDFTPDVEVTSIDEGYFDLTGARKSALEIADILRRTIRQSLKISVSEGIGPNKLISQIASKLNKPAAFNRVLPGQEIPFLHPLENFWLPGIGPRTAECLNTAGLARVGQIAQTPLELLALLLGSPACQVREFANGIDNRPVLAVPAPAQSYGHQETFAADTTDEEFVERTLRRMADDLMQTIRADGKSIRTVTVKVRYNDMAEDQRSESLTEPTSLETDIYPRLRPMLRQAWKRRVSLRLVSLKFSNVYDGCYTGELQLWPQQTEARHRLAAVVDKLREQHGPSIIMRARDLKPATTRARPVAKTKSNSLAAAVPLRVHSYYSFLNSTLSIRAIVELAVRHKLPAVALTDPNLHGAVEFIETAKACGIKPILGAEHAGQLFFVENKQGYRNLCRILSGIKCNTTGLIIEPAARWRPVHYAEPVDRLKYDIIQSIRTLTLLRQEHPEKHLGGDFHFAAEPSSRAGEIIERCNFEFELGKLQFPAFTPPDGSLPVAFLRRLVTEGARRRYRVALPQIDEELAIIHDVGYEEYFLVVWNILQECRRRGIDWITRGSAADSLVCYCLGISDVCPIRYDLYFRRFLNKERMQLNKLPDIDVDFPHDRKDDVLDLIFELYGHEHAAMVGGFSTYHGRSALADICKVLGVSEYQVRRFTERLPHVHGRELPAAIAASPECRDLPADEPPYSTAIKMAGFLDGFPRYPKMHPCGIVLSRDPIHDLVPTFISNKAWPTTHFDMDSVEAIGLVKIDILAQGGLAAMRDVRASLNTELRLPQQHEPLDDPAVWEMIARGGARAVHHIESPAMISLCKMCNVREIDGLIAIVSVIRPGAANGEKKMTFTRRYQGLEPTAYPHPSLKDCLKSSFGLVVYEEQILQICEAFAGLPPGRADLLRRALAKENWPRVEELGQEFFAAAKARGHSADVIDQVWKLVSGFSGYAFCKAHSTAYGVEAYQSAWLKKYYPAEFMAAVLSNGKGFYRPIVYVLECHRLGIPLMPPWINDPGPLFKVVDGHIRVPVNYIKGLTGKTTETILAGAPFESISDAPGSREEKELLLRAGAFDGFGKTRTKQFWQMVQPAFWGRDSEAAPDNLTEPTRRQRLQWESELFGFPASGHPLELFDDIAWDTYVPIADLPKHIGETINCCGLIIEDRVHSQVTGELMKFLTIADWTGIIETELFADTYKTYGLATVRYPVLELTATVEPFENNRGCSLRVLRAGKPRKIHNPVPVVRGSPDPAHVMTEAFPRRSPPLSALRQN